MPDLVGLKLKGRYMVLSRIGGGGMADVYRAFDSKREHHVALKVIRSEYGDDEGFRLRFEREAEVLKRLQHDHIVRFYDFETDDALTFIVMQLIEGTSLRERLRAQPGLQPHKAMMVLAPLAAALAYAHAEGIVHRDVKSANVLIRESDEQVLLSDFGIARATQDAALTRTAAPVGTPQYMSPEQCLGRAVDGRSDVYSLGVMAYEMLVGRRPFLGDSGDPTRSTGERIIAEQCYATPPSPCELNPQLPREVGEALLKVLAKDPSVRYQSARAFTDALATAFGETLPPLPTRTVRGPIETSTPTEGGERRLPRLLWAATCVGVIVVMVWIGYGLTGPSIRTRLPAWAGGGAAAEAPRFTIVVTQFGQIDAQGKVTPWDEGARLSRAVHAGVSDEIEAAPNYKAIAGARYSNELIEGADPPQRLEAARRLAEQTGASLVVYGNLSPGGSRSSFVPEFYIREGRTVLEGAEELLGSNQLGTPLAWSGVPFPLIDGVRARTQALGFFAIGLAYMTSGMTEEAADWFLRAESVKGWQEKEGKEVLYLHLGTVFSAESASRNLQVAEQYFRKATDVNPQYARAYIGLGNIHYGEFARSSTRDPKLLDLAKAEYEKALQATDKPLTARVEAKAHVSLGNVYLVKAQLGEPDLYARAEREYTQVVREYEAGNTALKGLAATAYRDLGGLHEAWTRDTGRIAAYYGKCIGTAEEGSDLKKVCEAQLGLYTAGATR